MGQKQGPPDRPRGGLADALLKAGVVDESAAGKADRERRRQERALGAEGRARREAERQEAFASKQRAEAEAARERERQQLAASAEQRPGRLVRDHLETGSGNRRWFFDAGRVVDGKLMFDQMLTTSGGIFGPDFDPGLVERLPWGSLELDLDCNSGTATYSSNEQGFGSGVLNVIRLTSIDGLNCPP